MKMQNKNLPGTITKNCQKEQEPSQKLPQITDKHTKNIRRKCNQIWTIYDGKT